MGMRGGATATLSTKVHQQHEGQEQARPERKASMPRGVAYLLKGAGGIVLQAGAYEPQSTGWYSRL